jgi:hypothetical protein
MQGDPVRLSPSAYANDVVMCCPDVKAAQQLLNLVHANLCRSTSLRYTNDDNVPLWTMMMSIVIRSVMTPPLSSSLNLDSCLCVRVMRLSEVNYERGYWQASEVRAPHMRSHIPDNYTASCELEPTCSLDETKTSTGTLAF